MKIPEKRDVPYEIGMKNIPEFLGIKTTKYAVHVDKNGVINKRTINHAHRIKSKITQISDEREATKNQLRNLLKVADKYIW